MTLVIAIGCTDGVILAADSASSDVDSHTKQPSEKIRQLKEEPILYGGSGDGGLLDRIAGNLEASYQPKRSLKAVRQELRKLILPDLKEAIETHVQYPQSPFHQPPEAIHLLVGVLNDEPWILEIERDGRDTWFGERLGYFAAIGSGKPWAQAIFRPHLWTERDLRLGQIFAYRTMTDAIDLAAAFLAPPIRIFTISLDGSVTEADSEELQQLEADCELWRQLEREAVGDLLTSRREAAAGKNIAVGEVEEIPSPDEPDEV